MLIPTLLTWFSGEFLYSVFETVGSLVKYESVKLV